MSTETISLGKSNLSIPRMSQELIKNCSREISSSDQDEDIPDHDPPIQQDHHDGENDIESDNDESGNGLSSSAIDPRICAIDEIVSVQGRHLEDFNVLNEVFKVRFLMAIENEEIPLSYDDILLLFGFVDELILANQIFFSHLKDIETDVEFDIGVRLVKGIEIILEPYYNYANNYKLAVPIIDRLHGDEVLCKFISEFTKVPRCHGLPFRSYITMPIKHMVRIRLLILNLLKYTPGDHADLNNINYSLELCTQAGYLVNSALQPVNNFLQLEKKPYSSHLYEWICIFRFILRVKIIFKIIYNI